MNVLFKKRFIEDLKNIPPPFQENIKKLVFDEIPKYNNFERNKKCKKDQI